MPQATEQAQNGCIQQQRTQEDDFMSDVNERSAAMLGSILPNRGFVATVGGDLTHFDCFVVASDMRVSPARINTETMRLEEVQHAVVNRVGAVIGEAPRVGD